MKRASALFRFFLFTAVCASFQVVAQAPVDSLEQIQDRLDSLYIAETEEVKGPEKVLHAEPLFIDLIRDLGARKGEREWNVAMGMVDRKSFDQYIALVEYEFAPINRLGFEIELPFSLYYPVESGIELTNIPSSRLNSLKLATQYSFYVSEKRKTSLALGYIHEFELVSFKDYGKKGPLKGHIYNPFFVAAKRWGDHFHTLIYSGPVLERAGITSRNCWQVNTNFHYMLPGTRNFVGLEINQEREAGKIQTILRPQMRLGLAHNLLVGIVTGIPLQRDNQRFSSFIRLIYEPKHKVKSRKV